jgi:hypothetical protein
MDSAILGTTNFRTCARQKQLEILCTGLETTEDKEAKPLEVLNWPSVRHHTR